MCNEKPRGRLVLPPPEGEGKRMGKVVVFLAVCGLLVSAATCVLADGPPARVKPKQTQQVLQVKPASGTLTVNDFHIMFKGQIQRADEVGVVKWLDGQLSDLDVSQLHSSIPSEKTAGKDGDWFELQFTFADTVLTPTQGLSFGFAVNGGIDITDYMCFWTYNGAIVKNVPKVVAGAKVEEDKPKTTVANLMDAVVAVQRKIGKNTTKPTIRQLAEMTTLPDEEIVDPTPINIPSLGKVEIEWPKPPLEPGVVSRTYYKRTFFLADGTKCEYTEAFTVEVIPEPSTCLGLAAGLLGLVGVIRRKK
jgi:hypothetical protein